MCRNNTGFLPAALVLGLQPGVPLIIPIVVVAEDGVTSQRYFVSGALFLTFNCSCFASLPTLSLADLTMKAFLKLTWAAQCNTWLLIKLAPQVSYNWRPKVLIFFLFLLFLKLVPYMKCLSTMQQ